eukprot:CFRG5985T1
MLVPETVTVIIYSGRSLIQGATEHPVRLTLKVGVDKKQTADCMGTTKPIWNEKCEIRVQKGTHLKIRLMVGTVTLGGIRIPVNVLPHEQGERKSWYEILSESGEKICELCIQAWVSSMVEKEQPKKSKFKSLSNSFLHLNAKSVSTSKTSFDGENGQGLKSAPNTVTQPPVLSKFAPTSGFAGTHIRLNGLRLGHKVEDILSITVAGANASSIEWINSTQLKIVTNNKARGEGPVIIRFVNGRVATSTQIFKFVEAASDVHTPQLKSGIILLSHQFQPYLKRVFPTSGPASGKQWIQIEGNNLGEARDDIVYVSVAGSVCDPSYVTRISASAIKVITNAGVGSGPVLVVTKSGGLSVSEATYTYMPRPMGSAQHANDDVELLSLSQLRELISEQKDFITDLKRCLDNSYGFTERLIVRVSHENAELLSDPS